MKVLLFNGSPHKMGCTYTALREAADSLEKNGVETELLWIGTQPVSGCIACRSCQETGECVIDDQVNRVLRRLEEFDGFIFGAPVYFSGPAGQLCCFMDRLFFAGRDKLRGKPGAAVVSCRRSGATSSLARLNKYFTVTNMPVVSSQYWNLVHGNTPEEVRQDAEGMQTMRALGQSMAYLLRSFRAAADAGVPLPVREERVFTNFIR